MAWEFCRPFAHVTRNEEPERASRPFERPRGFVIGEGGAYYTEADPLARAAQRFTRDDRLRQSADRFTSRNHRKRRRAVRYDECDNDAGIECARSDYITLRHLEHTTTA